MRAIDLTGQRFGRLVAIEISGKNRYGHRLWLCRCDCGRTTCAVTGALRGGLIRSCGCLHIETCRQVNWKHGQYRSGAYSSWLCMIQRCTNPKNTGYRDYGARGITVCQQWRDFETFLADMGPRPVGASLDRLENTGNYEKRNCRWATKSQQSNNTRTVTRLKVNGITRTLHEWAEETRINPRTIQKRLNLGWSHTQALGVECR